jgi:Ceramidase
MASAYVHTYCERTGPALWNEPLNAATNLAFIVAAVLLLRALARAEPGARADWGPWALIALVFLIGIGSALFHTLAVRWTALADVAPIALFILLATYLALRRLGHCNILIGLAGTLAVLGLAVGLSALLRFGGGAYLAALAAMLAIGLFIRLRRSRPAGTMLLAAAGIFAVSLTLRTLDGPLCGALPTGTHFLWHILNAAVLYLVTLAIIRHGERAG